MKIRKKLNTEEIQKAVKDNGGFCPCKLTKSNDTRCPCKEFKEQNNNREYHCGLYEITEVEE